MKRLDASEQAIVDIHWSSDGKWVSYTLGEEIRLANVETDEIRIIGKGTVPRLTPDNRVIFERDGEICAATAGNTGTIISKADLVKDTSKGFPLPSPDGEILLFCVFNVFDKESQTLNAYPYRHFIGQSNLQGQKAKVTKQQWYGGDLTWFQDSSRFVHFEFDSTVGPQIHIVHRDGKTEEGKVAGLYPSISPDNRQIAAKPRNGGSIVVYNSKGTWEDKDITTAVVKIPLDKAARPSASPPVWIDNRTLLVVEGDSVYRVDIKKEKCEPLKKIPMPTDRRKASLVSSPNREYLALETAVEGGFELRVLQLG